MLALISGKFKKMPVGSVCPSSQAIIDNEKECKQAAEKLGMSFGYNFQGDNSDNYPPGCIHNPLEPGGPHVRNTRVESFLYSSCLGIL